MIGPWQNWMLQITLNKPPIDRSLSQDTVTVLTKYSRLSQEDIRY